jgi:hypothetical protein
LPGYGIADDGTGHEPPHDIGDLISAPAMSANTADALDPCLQFAAALGGGRSGKGR